MAEASGESLNTLLEPQAVLELVNADYSLNQPQTCHLIRRGFNDHYRLTAGATPYIFRVYLNGKYYLQSPEAMLFELELLDFLRERGVQVAAPLRRNDGALLGWTATPAGQRATALFELAPGDTPKDPPSPTQARELGKAVAELHLATNDFSSPHERYHLNVKYLVEQPLELIGQQDDKNLQEALAALQPVEALVDQITALSTKADEYGVIHGDLHFGNMHFVGDRVTLFDFDHCAYGWRAYDLVAALFLPEAQQSAFFEGYESLRPLSAEERDSIPVFAKLRTLWDIGDMLATEAVRMNKDA